MPAILWEGCPMVSWSTFLLDAPQKLAQEKQHVGAGVLDLSPSCQFYDPKP